MAKRWQSADISYLQRYGRTKPVEELARRFKTDARTVREKLAELAPPPAGKKAAAKPPRLAPSKPGAKRPAPKSATPKAPAAKSASPKKPASPASKRASKPMSKAAPPKKSPAKTAATRPAPKPAPAKPAAPRRPAAKPGTSKPAAAKALTSKPGPAKPSPAKPSAPKPAAHKPEPVKAAAPKPAPPKATARPEPPPPKPAPPKPAPKPAVKPAPAADLGLTAYTAALTAMHKQDWARAAKLFEGLADDDDQPELAARARQFLLAARQRLAAESKGGGDEDAYLQAVFEKNRGNLATALEISCRGGRDKKDERFAYLVASVFALESRAEEAAQALAQAVELNPKNRIHAYHDADFAELRKDRDFRHLFDFP